MKHEIRPRKIWVTEMYDPFMHPKLPQSLQRIAPGSLERLSHFFLMATFTTAKNLGFFSAGRKVIMLDNL